VTERPLTNPKPDRRLPEASLKDVESLCATLIEAMQLEMTTSASEEEGIIKVNFSGPDRPILLSGGAQVLNCMEYLVSRMFRTGRGSEVASIVLDSDSYRQHREAELVLLAQMASQKVLSHGKALTLQPMTPRERRIVHLALAAVAGVRSESEGEGDNRSITIFPV
jgi:spoIIIJ-associated protein